MRNWTAFGLYALAVCLAGAAAAGPFTQLQLLMPGETNAPGTPTGRVGTPNPQTAGASFTVRAIAVDTNWTQISTNDVVGISSSDAYAVLPGNLQLIGGARNFSVTLKTAGAQTVTATDITDGSKTPGTGTVTTVNPGAFVKMQLLVPGETANPGSATGKIGTPAAATAGTPFNVSIHAVDANWNVCNTNHLVGVSSTDTNAVLPGNGALTAGTRVASVTLMTAGNRTITATNATDASKTASTSPAIPVNAGAPVTVRVETLANGSGTVVPAKTITAGDAVTGFAITRDAQGNFASNAQADAWSLVNISGDVLGSDVVPAGDSRSAAFTGLGAGSANIRASIAGLSSVDSGTIIVTPVPALSISDVTVVETATFSNAIFRVNLSAASTLTTSFTLTTSNGTAVAGSDYVATNRIVNVPPGMTTTTLTVRVTGDSLYETNETFFVHLAAAVNATVSDGVGQGTINNDDAAPVLSISNPTLVEGSGGTVPAVFTVTQSALSGVAASFAYASSNGTATVAGGDYVAAAGVLSIPAGQTSTSLVVTVNSDLLFEHPETFRVILSAPEFAAIASGGTGTATITDDDAMPQVALHDDPFDNAETPDPTPGFDFTGGDVDGNADELVYELQWSLDPRFAAGVVSRTSDAHGGFVNSENGGDLSPFTESERGRFTIQPADALSNSLPNQAIYWRARAKETAGAAAGDFGGWSAVRSLRVLTAAPRPLWHQTTDAQFGTDTHADTAPTWAHGVALAGSFVRSVEYVEIVMGSGQTNVSVALTKGQATSNCVPFATLMAAGAGADFDSLMPDLYFEPGPRVTAVRRAGAGTLTIGVTIVEFDAEAVRVQQGVMNISGTSGTVAINPVNLNRAAMVFNYRSPETGDHYRRAMVAGWISASNQVSFARTTSDRAILGHFYVFEALGTQFSVQSVGFGISAVATQATAAIAPVATNRTFLIASYNTAHTNSNPNMGNVGIYLRDPTQIVAERYVAGGEAITTIRVFAVTFDGTGSVQRGGWNFAAGDTQQSAPLAPVDLRVAMPWNSMGPPGIMPLNIANSGNSRGYEKIQLIDAGTVRGTRGESGTAARGRWEVVSWPAPFRTNGTVTSPGIPFTWVPGMDSWGEFSFAHTLTNGTIHYDVQYWDGATWADTDITNRDVSPVDLSGLDADNVHTQLRVRATFAALDTEASPVLRDWAVSWRGFVTNNPIITIDDVPVTEGDAGTVEAMFTVQLSDPSDDPVSVNYATTNVEAEAGLDYTALSGSLVFSPGMISTTLTVLVTGDTVNEGDETYRVELAEAVNGTVGDGTGVGTIADDDVPVVTIGDATVLEGNAGPVPAVFTLNLSAVSDIPVSVDFATTNGTAAPGADFGAATGSVTIDPGMTSTTITVLVTGDTLDELDETFGVALGNPVECAIGDEMGEGLITDDDNPPSVSIGDATVTEGDAGTVEAAFTVSLSAASGLDVSAAYATSDNTAFAGPDFEGVAGTVNLPAGLVSTTVVVLVHGDVLDESDEAFTVGLEDSINAGVGDGTGVGTITDDDPTPQVSVGDASAPEGNVGSVGAVFTVALSSLSSVPVSVNYATSNETALSGLDYGAVSGTLVFNPGASVTTVTISVFGDFLAETNETFALRLSGPSGATLGDGVGICTIVDDDSGPALTITNIVRVGGGVQIFWAGVSGRLHTVQFTPANIAPGGWTNLAGYTDVPGINGSMQATDAAPGATNRFYRVRRTLSP